MSVSNDPASPTQGQSAGNNWVAFFVASLGGFMVTLDAGIVTVSFPSLVDALNTDATTVVWVTLAYFTVGTGLLFTMGWIGDVMGRRKIYTLGIVVFTVGLALAPLSQSIVQLILVRVVQAVGHSMVMSNGLAIITQAISSKERGKAMGLHAAILALGLGGGPAVGGVIVDSLEWQAIFYTRIPLGILGAALAWALLSKGRGRQEPLQVDYPGALTLFGVMTVFLLMLNQGGRLGFTSPLVLAMAAVTAAMVPLLTWLENRAARPIIDMALFRRRQFNIGLALHYVHFVGVGAIFFLSPFYFIDGLGYSAGAAGLFLTVFFAMRIFLSPGSGLLTDRLGYRLPSSLGMAIMAVGVFMVSRLGIDADLPSIILGMAVAGLGSALVDPANTSSVMGAVSKERLGAAGAAVAAGRQIALSTGIALGGAIFALREQVYLSQFVDEGVSETVAAARAIVEGFGDALLAMAIPLALAVALAMMKRRARRDAGERGEAGGGRRT